MFCTKQRQQHVIRQLTQKSKRSIFRQRLTSFRSNAMSRFSSKSYRPIITEQSSAFPSIFSRTLSTRSEHFSNSSSSSSSPSYLFGAAMGALTLGVATTLTMDTHQQPNNVASCSGILGVVGKEGSSREFFTRGIEILQQRGYDGVGIASMDDKGSLVITKRVVVDQNNSGGVGVAEAPHEDGVTLIREHFSSHPTLLPTGMVHTRWATTGDKLSESNVHPHLDTSGKIALIHNGSVINARDLRNELKALGHEFKGQTDSEVLAKLIGHYYDTQKGRDGERISIKDATQMALDRCMGTWGMCLLCSDDPDELIVASHGSPLYIGLGDDRIFVASELNAFSKYTKNYISMKDGEIGVLDAEGRTLDLTRKQASKTEHIEEVLPSQYPHWTLKEIEEQPQAVARALGFGARIGWNKIFLGGLDTNVEFLRKIRHLVLVGCGSSLQAARYGERLIKHVMAVPGRVSSMDGVECDSDDFARSEDPGETGVIALTQSGETSDIKRVVGNASDDGLTTLGVVNIVGSEVARMVNMGVYCHAGNEHGVSSTKSFTSQVAILGLIALWFRELQDTMKGLKTSSVETDRLKEALLRLPISLGMVLKTREQCKKIAERLSQKEHCFVLGKGFGESIAYEGALKIKEMSYLHSEGYSGGALKHGPFALIEDDKGKFGATPIIMLVLDDQHSHHMRTACEEVKARGADLIIITDKAELARDLDDHPIVIPSNDVMTALVALLPLQMIAYELSLLRGNNPDLPRNLAKYHR